MYAETQIPRDFTLRRNAFCHSVCRRILYTLTKCLSENVNVIVDVYDFFFAPKEVCDLAANGDDTHFGNAIFSVVFCVIIDASFCALLFLVAFIDSIQEMAL